MAKGRPAHAERPKPMQCAFPLLLHKAQVRQFCASGILCYKNVAAGGKRCDVNGVHAGGTQHQVSYHVVHDGLCGLAIRVDQRDAIMRWVRSKAQACGVCFWNADGQVHLYGIVFALAVAVCSTGIDRGNIPVLHLAHAGIAERSIQGNRYGSSKGSRTGICIN